MGYCYEVGVGGKRGRLCCDRCGNAGGVRKVACKYGWCQSNAICPTCRKNGAVKEYHAWCDENCKESAERWAERQDDEQRKLNDGQFVLRSAVGVGDGKVSAIFKNVYDHECEIIVTKEEYDAQHGGGFFSKVVTLEDFGIGTGVQS